MVAQMNELVGEIERGFSLQGKLYEDQEFSAINNSLFLDNEE